MGASVTLTVLMIIERKSHSEEHTERIAVAVARCLRPRDVLALKGPLGSGKTCFVRGLIRGLGGDPREVSSPTFVIAQEYSIGSDLAVIHIDAYRVSRSDELESIGWDETLEREDVIFAIEWPENLHDSLPPLRSIRVDFEHAGPTDRTIRLHVPAHMDERFRPLVPKSRACPMCGKIATSDDPHFPFCSQRCRWADLGEWFDEERRIAGS